jgi:nucleotide-binding universal stress UspA family protein
MIPLKHKTVVVPIDFSDDSEAAIRAGLDRVENPDDLHVVHVLFPLDYRSPGVLREFASGEDREAVARRHIEELIKKAGAQGAHAVVLTGNPGMEVADYAKRHNTELIVVTSHGSHGMKRFLLGSTAERIIRHAHCSVLVLRRPEGE